MDRNKDGVVTVEEFIESCKKVRRDFNVERDLVSSVKGGPFLGNV